MNQPPVRGASLLAVALLLIAVSISASHGREPSAATAPGSPAAKAKSFDFANALVPGACGWEGGRLTKGLLQRPDPDGGEPRKIYLLGKRRDSGRLTDDRRYHAATIGCGQYHRGPDTVVLWSPNGDIAWSLDVGGYFGEYETYIRTVRFTEKGLTVFVRNVQQPDDYFYAGSLVARMRIDSVDDTVQVVQSRTVDERSTASQFVQAVASGRRSEAASLSSKRIMRRAMRAADGKVVRGGECIGLASESWPQWVETENIRMCYMTVEKNGYGTGYGLFLRRQGWRTWSVDEFVGVAG